jgi:hypothetical protein
MSRNKVGFKTNEQRRQDSLPHIRENQPLLELQIPPRAEAILMIAQVIDKLMDRKAQCMGSARLFSETHSRDLEDRLDKLYIRYYEPM